MHGKKELKGKLTEVINGSFLDGNSPYKSSLRELFFGSGKGPERKDGVIALIRSTAYRYLGYHGRKKRVIDLLFPGELWFLTVLHRHVCLALEEMYDEEKPANPTFRPKNSDVVKLVELKATELEEELKATGKWLAAKEGFARGGDSSRFSKTMRCWMPPVGTKMLIETDFGNYVQVEVISSEGIEGSHISRYGMMEVGGKFFVGGLSDLVRYCRQKPSRAWDVCMTHLSKIGEGTNSPVVTGVLAAKRFTVLRSTMSGGRKVSSPKGVVNEGNGSAYPWEDLGIEGLRTVRQVADGAAGWLEREPDFEEADEEREDGARSEEEPEPTSKAPSEDDEESASKAPEDDEESASLFFLPKKEYWQAVRDDEVVWPSLVFPSEKLAAGFGGGGDTRRVEVYVDSRGVKHLIGPPVEELKTQAEADEYIERILASYVREYERDMESAARAAAAGFPIDLDNGRVDMEVVKKAAAAVGYTPRYAAGYLEKLSERRKTEELRNVGGVRFRRGVGNGSSRVG